MVVSDVPVPMLIVPLPVVISAERPQPVPLLTTTRPSDVVVGHGPAGPVAPRAPVAPRCPGGQVHVLHLVHLASPYVATNNRTHRNKIRPMVNEYTFWLMMTVYNVVDPKWK